MAPFRNRDRSNRSGRGQVEHNVLEGLPINQYREVEVTIGPDSTETKHVDKDAYWPELPMPRDSHMLPEHSQQLLRAARSGRIYKPPAPPEEDRETVDEEDENKEVQQGFTVKKWVKVPRHLEDPEPEFLAKRRKGLPSQYAAMNGQTLTQPTPMRETKVKKLDAEGNVNVYKVLVPEGQTIADEVQEADVAVTEGAPAAAAAPGTVVEGVGVVNAEGVVVANEILQQTPPRRRPPIPKKKSRRGPGRGKKKVVFAEGSAEQPAPAAGSHLPAVARLKDEAGSVEPSDGGDTPMADAGDEEDGSDEDGSDDDDHEMKDSPAPTQEVTPSNTLAEPTGAPDIEPSKEAAKEATKEAVKEPSKEPSPMQEIPIAMEPPVLALAPSTTPKEPLPPSPISTEPFLPAEPVVEPEKKQRSSRDPSSSPELPLSAIAHSRTNSINQMPTLPLESSTLELPLTTDILKDTTSTEPIPNDSAVKEEAPADTTPQLAGSPDAPATEPAPSVALQAQDSHLSDGEDDLLGSLERHLDKDESMGGS